MTDTFPGLYRGTVSQNVDPMQIGRVQVTVPDVSGIGLSTWARPCFPMGGPAQGFFSVPMIGAGVFVMYEQGDPDYPVWMGTFLGSPADKPLLANTVPPAISAVTMQTLAKNGIVITDAGGPMGVGGITIQSTSGATIAVNDIGITITNGKGAIISMVGNAVDINAGALTII
ncbi:MAG: phage baseplate assembly protein V [Paracoccaceae bacterium]